MLVNGLKSRIQRFKTYAALTYIKLINSNIGLYRIHNKLFFKAKKGSIEELIDSYCRRKKIITFIQAGGNDGKTWDPIYPFVQRYKWQGVILEPQHEVFHTKLIVNYRNNKRVELINAALDRNDGVRTLYKISFSEKRWATGLASFLRTNLEDNVNSGYADSCAEKWGDVPPSDKADYIKEELVNCISFKTIFLNQSFDKLDFLVIDTEGYDYEIIKMLDFNSIKPINILYEQPSSTDGVECAKLLSSMGYKLVFEGINTLASLTE